MAGFDIGTPENADAARAAMNAFLESPEGRAVISRMSPDQQYALGARGYAIENAVTMTGPRLTSLQLALDYLGYIGRFLAHTLSVFGLVQLERELVPMLMRAFMPPEAEASEEQAASYSSYYMDPLHQWTELQSRMFASLAMDFTMGSPPVGLFPELGKFFAPPQPMFNIEVLQGYKGSSLDVGNAPNTDNGGVAAGGQGGVSGVDSGTGDTPGGTPGGVQGP